MGRLYSYEDYEEAYYHNQYGMCKEIGLYLLSSMYDDKSKKFYHKLNKAKLNYNNLSDREAELLSDVRLWLMVNK